MKTYSKVEISLNGWSSQRFATGIPPRMAPLMSWGFDYVPSALLASLLVKMYTWSPKLSVKRWSRGLKIVVKAVAKWPRKSPLLQTISRVFMALKLTYLSPPTRVVCSQHGLLSCPWSLHAGCMPPPWLFRYSMWPLWVSIRMLRCCYNNTTVLYLLADDWAGRQVIPCAKAWGLYPTRATITFSSNLYLVY